MKRPGRTKGLYQPDRGDFVFVNFTPQSGTEQAGRRPALVLSPASYNIATGLMLAVPVTNQVKGGAFEVPIPRGAVLTGVVPADQIRCLDWNARAAEFHSKASEQMVLEVLARLEAILRISLDP